MTAALETLCGFIASPALREVPGKVLSHAKLQILDALTSAVASAHGEPGKMAAHALDPIDGGGPARVISSGAAASVNTAVWVNTQMSAMLDLGANLLFSQGLGGLAVFGPLALAESTGAAGASLLRAVIAGYEVAGRVALSFPATFRMEGRRLSGLAPHGPGTRWVAFGAAAANATLRSLDGRRIAHALALTAASLPPPRPRSGKRSELPMAKYGLFGNMATSALAATLLAERGFTGDLHILEAADGFHRMMGSICADPAALARGLGERWLIAEAGLKRYPSGTHNQQAIHVLEQMLHDHPIDPERIRAIRVYRAIGTSGAFADPAPTNEVDAQFSLPFALAAAACGVLPREWHTRVADERVRALAARVRLLEDAQAVSEFAALPLEAQRSPWSLRSRVLIETRETSFERWSQYDRLSEHEAADKFRHYCEGILPERQIAKAVEAVFALERLADVRELTSAFAR